MFLCSVFVVFLLFSFILVFSRHFKRVPCLFLAIHMSNFYVFSIFGIYTLTLLGLLLSCPRFFRCVFPFFHYYLFLRFFVFAGTVLCFSWGWNRVHWNTLKCMMGLRARDGIEVKKLGDVFFWPLPAFFWHPPLFFWHPPTLFWHPPWGEAQRWTWGCCCCSCCSWRWCCCLLLLLLLLSLSSVVACLVLIVVDVAAGGCGGGAGACWELP